MKRRPLLYLETSIFGFFLDSEPRNALRREAVTTLLEQVRLGLLDAVTSAVTLDEVSRSPEPLRPRLLMLLDDVGTIQADRPEVERLARAYVRDGVITAVGAAGEIPDGFDQSGFTEHPQVLGNLRLAHDKPLRNFPNGVGVVAQQLNNT